MEDQVTARQVNTAFAEKLERGMVHEAAVSLTSFVRRRLREESFMSNKIMTEQTITDADLDKDVNLDRVRKIVELEPDSRAMWISFRGLPNSDYLDQEAAEVPFAIITTDEVKKNIIELKTRSNDVRKIISDNQIKDMLAEQDARFIAHADRIVADFPDQQFTFHGGLSKANFAEALKFLPKKKIPTACALMNETTSKELLKWNSDDIGFEFAGQQYEKGLLITTLMGIKLIVTIKNEIVKDDEVYFFGPEDYLGKFYTLQDATVYMETRGLYVSFYAYKVLGMLIANTNAVFKGIFKP